MSLTEQINADIKAAMLAREKEKLEALRAVKAALLLEGTKDGSGEVSDATGLEIIAKLVKQRRDASAIFKEQGREDLAKDEDFQIEILNVYLPAQMSEDEVRAIVKATIAQSGASGPQDMGKVMGPVMGKLKGKADGAIISKLVKEELAG
ncbi:MAG: GatB/YqeY domain-containing protein [Vicingus serpentipes]|nr:GatB/YqeY domain-containing protein [Vicingus serpentipes]